MENLIKRGVTVYSFKQLVAEGQLTWDQCIAAMANMGVNGIELLGQLFFRNCPDVDREDLARWKDMMWKYGTKTIAHDFFVDRTLFKGRELTLRESVEIVKRHVRFAAAIDCPIVRIGGTFDPQLFAEAAPICEEYGVKLGVEIHNGSSSWILPDIQRTIDIIRKKDTPYLGIIPDMSMFVKHIREGVYFTRAARAAGVDPDLIEAMKAAYEQESNEAYRARCDRMLAEPRPPAEAMFLRQCRRTEYHDPKLLLEHMPYILHIHGKFWNMDEQCEETSIDYPNILPVLVQGGYTGYISSEYEGGPVPGDPFLPLRRFQAMLDRYLGAYPGFPMPTLAEKSTDTQALSNKGFRNRYDAAGTCTGFEVEARCFYYRGVPLCLVDDCRVTVDGETFGPDRISFEVEGQRFSFAEMATVQAYYWNYGHTVKVLVDRPGGLDASRTHDFAYSHQIRTYYLPFLWTDRATVTMGVERDSR